MDSEPLSDIAHKEAANALIAWFQSQDIMPSDAGIIMCKVMAIAFVEKSKNIKTLGVATNLTAIMLSIEIAELLRGR